MARFKRRSRSRRRRRRRSTSRRGKNLNRQIKKVVLRTAETKRNGLLNGVALNCLTIHEVYPLGALIVQGTKKGQRIGSEINYMGLRIQYHFYHSNPANPSGWVRLLVCKALTKGTTVNSELFMSASNNVDGIDYNATSADINQIYAKINKNKWLPMFDKKIRVLAPSVSSDGRDTKIGSWFIPLRHKQRYEESVSTDKLDLSPQYRVIWFQQFDNGDTTSTITGNLTLHEYYKDP